VERREEGESEGRGGRVDREGEGRRVKEGELKEGKRGKGKGSDGKG